MRRLITYKNFAFWAENGYMFCRYYDEESKKFSTFMFDPYYFMIWFRDKFPEYLKSESSTDVFIKNKNICKNTNGVLEPVDNYKDFETKVINLALKARVVYDDESSTYASKAAKAANFLLSLFLLFLLGAFWFFIIDKIMN